MSIVVKLSVGTEFRVGAGRDAVFAVLADVPLSASHYPDLDRLEDLGNNSYLWRLKAQSTAGLSHTVVYACQYASNCDAGTVIWTPVESVGNTLVTGRWELEAANSGTRIGFETTVTLRIPGPALLRPIVAPFVEHTFRQQIEHYHQNLQRTFSDYGAA